MFSYSRKSRISNLTFVKNVIKNIIIIVTIDAYQSTYKAGNSDRFLLSLVKLLIYISNKCSNIIFFWHTAISKDSKVPFLSI
jgi:hypothetical protein